MDGNGLGEATNASDLNVDNAASAQLQCSLGVAGTADGFVEAERSLQLPLKARVEVEVIAPKRLLDHQQLESVEAHKVLGVSQRVGRVGVAAQQNIGPEGADLFKHLKVPASFHFYLDTLVSGGQFGFNLLQQLLVRVLDADADPACDLAVCTAEQLPQR